MDSITRELREIFSARIQSSFDHARTCLGYARAARQSGDSDRVRDMLWCIRAFRVAAVAWRERARKLAPMLLMCLLMGFTGCVTSRPVPVTDNLSAPLLLFRPVCDRLDFNHAPRDAHWSGYAELVWDSDGDRVVAIDCDLLSMSAGFAPLSERFDIRAAEALKLRQFLRSNGVETNWTP